MRWHPLRVVTATFAAAGPLGANASLTRPSSKVALNRQEAEEYRTQWALLDTNSDGKISAAELAKVGQPNVESSEEEPEERAIDARGPSDAEEPDAFEHLPAGEKLAVRSLATHVAHGMRKQVNALLGQEFGKHDLAFVNLPANFGQTVERIALEGVREKETPFILQGSFLAKQQDEQWQWINRVKGLGGQIWGQMSPDLRAVSNFTGCTLVFEPPKFWPKQLAENYFGDLRPFGLVRNPYDRLISEFREQASGGAKQAGELSRTDISLREGSLDREGATYQAFYSSCDVNGWVKEELKHYKAGDRYRSNCHLLPQAEYFEHPHGVSLPIDVRTLPDSFNAEMERHGYSFRMQVEAMRREETCSRLTAWDLDEVSKQLIKEVYASDFELLCRHFGYCNRDELTCLAQIPFMCGASG